MYNANYFEDNTSTVGRRSRPTFSTDWIFIDDVSTASKFIFKSPTSNSSMTRPGIRPMLTKPADTPMHY